MDCPQTETFPQTDFFERIKKSGQRIPLSGSLEVTFRCNLRCAHCYLGDNRNGVPDQKELTREEIYAILDQLAEAGTLWLLLTGGDPFVRPDFMDIYRYAVHKGFLVTVFTNGALLTERIVAELAELPPQMVEITLYGATKETYERITQIPGSYERCMRGIDLLLAHGIPLKLKTVVMSWNYAEFEDIKAIAAGKGVDFRYDSALVGAMTAGDGPLPLRITPQEAIALESNNAELKAELKAMLARTAGQPDNGKLYQCGAGLNSFHIDPYGMLYPCILSRPQGYDLQQGNFAEGWDVFMQQLRDQPAQRNDQCAQCDLAILCRQCPGKSHLETGNMLQLVQYFCQIGHKRADMLSLDV
mgnify:CR=1 FL=1